jgi:citrate synthase
VRNGKFYIRGKETILSKNLDFIDVAYDVVFGNESSYNKEKFKESVDQYFFVVPEIKKLLLSIDRNVHPMDFLAMGILGLSGIADKYLKSKDREDMVAFILAQTSIIIGGYYNLYRNRDILDVSTKTTFTQNIMRYFHPDKEDSKIQEWSAILNTILILHCEHGMNCSAATVRNIASAKSSVFSAISSGIAAFKGDLHGGASQKVSQMYDLLLEENISVKDYIEQGIQDKKPLMGFGQRTYNSIPGCWDPRVLTMKDMLDNGDFDFSSIQDYKRLCQEFITYSKSQEFFQRRNLTPNPDLFNCIFYKLFEVPNTMNPAMIALGRVIGWLANFYEHCDQNYPLSRPCDFGHEK